MLIWLTCKLFKFSLNSEHFWWNDHRISCLIAQNYRKNHLYLVVYLRIFHTPWYAQNTTQNRGVIWLNYNDFWSNDHQILCLIAQNYRKNHLYLVVYLCISYTPWYAQIHSDMTELQKVYIFMTLKNVL